MDRETEKPTQVYAGAAGNAVIAGSRLVGASVSGSYTMLSEGIHSIADTGNPLLLVFGLRKSREAADADHPFGKGQEVYEAESLRSPSDVSIDEDKSAPV